MLCVLSAVIGLLVGAAVVWIIQTTARRKDAALSARECQALQEQLNVAGADLKVAQARAQMLENSLEEQKEARKAEAEAMRREYDEKLQKMVLTFKDSAAEILKEKSRDLSAVNSEQIKNILDPLGKKMEGGVPPRCGGLQGEILEKQRVHRAADPLDDGTDHLHRQAGG